jgi:hypothetical protein
MPVMGRVPAALPYSAWRCEFASSHRFGTPELSLAAISYRRLSCQVWAEQYQVAKVGVALSGRLPWVLTRGRTSSH